MAGDDGSYGPLLTALSEAGLDVGNGRVEAASTMDDADWPALTRQRIEQMLHGDTTVILIVQPVLSFDFAGRSVHIRPDALVLLGLEGRLEPVELKGFRIRAGHYPAAKIATALEQTAVSQIALRRIVTSLGFDSSCVSEEVVVVCATGRGMKPLATRHANADRVLTLESRVASAEALLGSLPSPESLLKGITSDTDPASRLSAFKNLTAAYGTSYTPSCLQTCGAAFYCLEAANDDPARLGPTRLLARAGSIRTALAWADGATPTDPAHIPVATRLSEASALIDAARADAGLPARAPASSEVGEHP
ncbi:MULTISPECIES: hypothetical protein [unclassified Modestobacter]